LTGWLDVDEQGAPRQQRTRLRAELERLEMSTSEQALADLLGLPQLNLAENVTPASGPPNEQTLLLSLAQKLKPTSSPKLNQRLQGRLDQAESAGTAEQSVWQQLRERVSGPAVVCKLLHKLAARQRLVIILEELHWTDDDSLALLNELLALNLPALLVATSRDATGPERLTPLALAPLPETAIVQVAQRALGATTLDPALAEWICRRAGGNPLFAEELCHELLHSDAVHLDRSSGQVHWTRLAPALPLSLHQLLLARLDGLSLAQQAVLHRAAMFGLSFAYDGVVQLCHNRLGAAEVQSALADAVRASLLSTSQGTIYRFEHPLIQETIYSTLAFSQRQEWHTQIGDWLVAQHPAAETLPLELVAYHYLNGADRRKAARFGCLAGDRAKANGAYLGALEYYQQVLALTDAPQEELVRAAAGQADVLALQEDYETAQSAYSRTVELGRDTAKSKKFI
jgi:predicted ATPase